MRKNLLIIFSFLSVLYYTQKFNFDYLLTYDCTMKNTDFSKNEPYQIAVNSSNPDYVLYIWKYGNGMILNYKTDESYAISISALQDGKMDFQYLSRYKKEEKKEPIYYISKLNKSGDYIFQVFKNKKMRKVTSEVILKMQESPFNLLFIATDNKYQNRKFMLKQLQSSLDPKKNYIIENGIINYDNGYSFNFKFKKSEKYNIEIEVPQKFK